MSNKIEFKWRVDGLPFVKPAENGKKKVFAAVSLGVTGKRGNFEASRGTGVIQLPAPTGDFKAYEEVTPDDVVVWAKAEMNKHPKETVAFYEQEIKEEIERKETEAADLAKPIPMSFYVPPVEESSEEANQEPQPE